LLATIGVTRGFGDHDLRAQSQNGPIYIKPFLSPQPEVRVLDIENESIGESDVLVMATDGLWDVVTNERVAEIVESGEKDGAPIRRLIRVARFFLYIPKRGKIYQITTNLANGHKMFQHFPL
jgi:serine/threonine protein phosphatase PrpC